MIIDLYVLKCSIIEMENMFRELCMGEMYLNIVLMLLLFRSFL